jgi:hypothetical protein
LQRVIIFELFFIWWVNGNKKAPTSMMGQLHLLNAGKNKPRLSYSEAGLNVRVYFACQIYKCFLNKKARCFTATDL